MATAESLGDGLLCDNFLIKSISFCATQVVFATETLAAGVNMPARATVITSLSKRIDTGIVKLTPSQLLQMGGRYVPPVYVYICTLRGAGSLWES